MDDQTREYCWSVLEILGDWVDTCEDTGASFAVDLAAKLGIRYADNPLEIAQQGLTRFDTHELTMRVLDEHMTAKATARVIAELCSAMGHEYVSQESGRICKVCGVSEDEADDLGLEPPDIFDLIAGYDEIVVGCQAVISVLREDVDECYELGDRYVNEIAASLELPPVYDFDKMETMIQRGLVDSRTQGLAVKAQREYVEAGALSSAYIMFCTALGHDWQLAADDKTFMCSVCGVAQGEEPDLGFEGD
jgi:hypothetical protein